MVYTYQNTSVYTETFSVTLWGETVNWPDHRRELTLSSFDPQIQYLTRPPVNSRNPNTTIKPRLAVDDSIMAVQTQMHLIQIGCKFEIINGLNVVGA